VPDLIDKLVRPAILNLAPYHVPDTASAIKLDAMENPHSLPDEIIKAWLSNLASAKLNLYPDPKAQALSLELKDKMRMSDSLDLLLGNGSDELIQMILMTIAKPGAKVLSIDPTFVMYEMIAKFVGIEYIKVGLASDFGLDEDLLLKAIAKESPAVIFIANPNNPTGNLFKRQAIEKVIKAAPGLVVVDEAYFSFCKENFLPDLLKYPEKLLVMRTVSKLGLAGLRLGLLVGHHDWLKEFDKVRLPYNINVLTQLSGKFFLQHKEVLDKQASKIVQNREKLCTSLKAIPGIVPYPAEANFIMFKTPRGGAGEIHTRLIEQNILIKNLDNSANPRLQDCLRVSMGTEHENEIFIAALESIMSTLSVV